MSSYLYKYPIDLDTATGEYSHRITFTALIPQKSSEIPRLGNTVALYLPADALKTSYSQSYGDVEFGAAGLAVSSLGRGVGSQAFSELEQGNPLTALTTLANNVEGSNIKNALISGTVKEVMGKASGSMGGAGQTALQALSKTVGRVVNPHKAIIYQGPGGFRTFSYNFSMSPRSAEEADNIAKIVYFFKYHMHPGIPGAVSSADEFGRVSSSRSINSSASLTYPEEFQIDMRVNNRESGLLGTNGTPQTVRPLFRIDKCFLESFSVDYSTQGSPAFLNDDTPVTTTISLSFKETVLMTKSNIDQGY